MGLNRKDWLKLAGLLGLGATGAGLAGVGPLAGVLGGTGQAVSAGAAGASLAPGLAGPTTAGAGGAMGVGNILKTGAGMLGKAGTAMGAANTAMGMFGGQEPPQPVAPPPPNQFQPTPVASPYGDAPPPGIDPRQWAMMSPEQKRMMMMGRG